MNQQDLKSLKAAQRQGQMASGRRMTTQTIRSKAEKAADPRRQRKNLRNLLRDYGV